MTKRRQRPVALTIAGSDSGGGAGIQMDLKTFAALGVHGTSAITCLTAQNPVAVLAIEPASVGMVHRQLEAVFAELTPAAVKTGMLYSAAIVREVAAFLAARPAVTLVVDPVMVATSGTELLKPAGVRALELGLLPRAKLLMPNVNEASWLTGATLESVEDLRQAAREIRQRFGCAVLVKGGHLRGLREAVDIFYDGREELLLTAPFVRGIKTHGTGCAYSAAVTAWLARGAALSEAVTRAKKFVTHAIAGSYRAAGHFVLNTGRL